jgi:tetratricopeptide (TPR) repeat protein
MRKLIVTCECGQRLRVPYSALGKTGVCVTCGRTIQIMSGNTRREGFNQRGETSVLRDSQWARRAVLSEDDRQRFGKAVDLFAKQQYAEALAIFDSFLEQFPGNSDIEEARNQCLRALKNPRLGSPQETPPKLPGTSDARLDADSVKRVVLEKMLYDPSAANQLEAARIACQILGLFGNGSTTSNTLSAPSAPSPSETNPENVSSQENSPGNESENVV